MSYRTRNRKRAIRESMLDRARKRAGVDHDTAQRLAETFEPGCQPNPELSETRRALLGVKPGPPTADQFTPGVLGGEFPCPHCRKADGVHAAGCITSLAEIVERAQ